MIDTINKKKQIIKELNEKRKEYTIKNIEYKKEKCKLMIETDFNSILNKSRPTVDEKEAYVSLKTIKIREEKELLYNEIKRLELEIELCNDLLKLQEEQ